METTPDRPHSNLPAWPASASAPLAPAARPSWEEFPDPDAAPPKAFSPKLILRAMRRHWWQILLLWTVGSGALMALAYTKVKPTYDALAVLRVEPSNRGVIATQPLQNVEMTPFMETQAQLITNPDVLSKAIADEKVAALPRIRTAFDAEAELRKQIKVVIPPKTQLIVVSMTSESPTEGATIVNAVVESYMKTTTSTVDVETNELKRRYGEAKKRFQNQVDQLRDEMTALVKKSGSADPKSNPSQVALEDYKRYRARLSDVVLERIEAEVAVRTLRDALRPSARGKAARRELTPKEIDEVARRMYENDPEVLKLFADMKEAQGALDAAKRLVRKKGSDPAVQRHQQRLNSLHAQNDGLWNRKLPALRERVTAGGTAAGEDARATAEDPAKSELSVAELRQAKLRSEEAELQKQIEKIQFDTKTEGGDTLRAQFLEAELSQATDVLHRISTALEQIELEANGQAKVTSYSKARPPVRPTSDNRIKLVAAAPVGMLVLLVSIFVLIEARAARVGDPDDLAARARVGVLGVVPPLPSLENARGPKALRDQRRRLEEFVQSLDHLRVTICSKGPGGRRCVLITSATGGEGKTTLAAQLAGRCANAGLLTLVVDADLRRPSLGELLEVPEGPGLVDVLLGEAEPEQAMVVIGNAGGFHLLPAGSVGQDPSRLLQGERLGQLIARLREAFDVVIIDAPPVLAVPDALLLGRWTDGAVLAVRHDMSRFPLVDRANKRLASIGIPVLGAVVNGVRPSESTYGAYTYSTHYGEIAVAGAGVAADPGAELPRA